MKQLYKNKELRSFLILWCSQAVSSFGTAMTNFALIIWAYKQQGTVSSITLLSVCSYLPSILFCFLAGTLADRWNKKKIMLICDFIAALGTFTVFILYITGSLRICHLYVINFSLSFMNAFQNPATYVAVSLITPKEYFIRVSGLQAFSNSLVTIITPAVATAVLAFGGIRMILMIDLFTFAIAFTALLFFIKIPVMTEDSNNKKESFLKNCCAGLSFLRKHTPIWKMILFFSFINLLASMAGNSIMPAMVLARTGDNQIALGMVSSSIGIGALVGSILVTAVKPFKSKTKVIFISCAVSFLLCDILWGIGQNVAIWMFAAFAGNLPLPFLSANLTTIMRMKVPIEMQGRVFSTRDTFQYITIPVGLFLGGYLADNIFEPFMLNISPIQQMLSKLVGTGRGSGMAVIYLITGTIGFLVSLWSAKDPTYKSLD
ncbi:MAG: MFS transporter [Sedimentibacter sp.]|uniref:MFS transporter n=1 Tax=Sedimentibacter sp. TaxID=1960295 RepID=UPI003158D809